jgi:hypothetical protein
LAYIRGPKNLGTPKAYPAWAMGWWVLMTWLQGKGQVEPPQQP